MQIAPLPANEQERLRALKEYHILDTIPEAEFDAITHLASEICHTPVAMVTLVDAHRQWFKSKHGSLASETSRDLSFCAHAINTPYEVFIVPDASKDERFADNPLVTGEPNIIFYAGVPLVNPEGYALGTLCISDSQPKELSKKKIKALQSLARLVVAQFEQRKNIIHLRHSQDELRNAYADLESFSTIAAHDLKSPLNNIITITHLLEDDYSAKLDAEGNEYIGFLKATANQMSALVAGILNYSRSSSIILDQKENIIVSGLIEEVKGLMNIPRNVKIAFETVTPEIYTSRIALKQILLNLVDNAIKYNDKNKISITIHFREDNDTYTFEVKDNGPGITEDDQKRIFDLFTKLKNSSKDGKSSGVGLSIVKRLVEKLRGTITVQSELGIGTSFIFTLPK